MMKTDFEKIYTQFEKDLVGSQKRMEIESPIGIYYGISQDGYLRLSFLSSMPAPKIESTKFLRVFQGLESEGVFWTCFDLLQPEARKVYFAFCSNLIDYVCEALSEKEALENLKRRYIIWKSMFKKDAKQGLSNEMVQGLFGELYFLKKYLLSKYSVNECIQAWGGPDSTSKDFSMGKEWYEVKTVGESSLSIKISSLSQLMSEYDGHLCVVTVEKMSREFTNGESSVEELFRSILTEIKDEAVEALFLNKVSSFGGNITDDCFATKFAVKRMKRYRVDKDFPKMRQEDIKFAAICDVSYSLIISSIKDYMEE